MRSTYERETRARRRRHKILKKPRARRKRRKKQEPRRRCRNIFQKSPKTNNDVFFSPIDIGDNTIPNGNAMMLINFVRLGMMEEAKKLSESLNGYLNIYKNHMMTSLRAIDFYCNVKDGKNCNEHGCKIDV